ncbi:pilus assembly protein TadB [Alkaliphilus serpentinus]|uniref:Pilus assembly protein TadB n=2 Tax=Alkaliphilus serpentinus TaxID=1482731 RepID=A0A833MBB3_9FIRM|nr:pilus assembly protein TadB [Alkaliphilus serpentinus]
MRDVDRNPYKEDKDHVISSNQKPIDYDHYIMTTYERLKYIVIAAIVIFVIGYIFYRSIVFAAVLTPMALLYPKYKVKEIIKDRKKELAMQFKEALYALSSSLTAGKSIEVAFKDTLKDLSILYPSPETYINKELAYIIRKIEMNETVEEALLALAKRAHIEEIDSFTDVFITCKRTGGNIIEVIKNTAQVLGDKIEFRNDINVMLAQRKFEQKVLNLIPIFLILLLSYMSADYMEPVFTTIIGKIVMTISILLLLVGFMISKKIMDIEV